MIQLEKQWLSVAPWESVLSVNQALCSAKKEIHQPNPKGYDAARNLWEKSISRTMSLRDALDVCRRCQELGPFVLFNANTFTALGRTLLEDGLKLLPPVEAQIIRSTVSHYIAGMIGKRELAQVLGHFEALWRQAADSPAVPPPNEVPLSGAATRA